MVYTHLGHRHIAPGESPGPQKTRSSLGPKRPSAAASPPSVSVTSPSTVSGSSLAASSPTYEAVGDRSGMAMPKISQTDVINLWIWGFSEKQVTRGFREMPIQVEKNQGWARRLEGGEILCAHPHCVPLVISHNYGISAVFIGTSSFFLQAIFMNFPSAISMKKSGSRGYPWAPGIASWLEGECDFVSFPKSVQAGRDIETCLVVPPWES